MCSNKQTKKSQTQTDRKEQTKRIINAFMMSDVRWIGPHVIQIKGLLNIAYRIAMCDERTCLYVILLFRTTMAFPSAKKYVHLPRIKSYFHLGLLRPEQCTQRLAGRTKQIRKRNGNRFFLLFICCCCCVPCSLPIFPYCTTGCLPAICSKQNNYYEKDKYNVRGALEPTY